MEQTTTCHFYYLTAPGLYAGGTSGVPAAASSNPVSYGGALAPGSYGAPAPASFGGMAAPSGYGGPPFSAALYGNAQQQQNSLYGGTFNDNQSYTRLSLGLPPSRHG